MISPNLTLARTGLSDSADQHPDFPQIQASLRNQNQGWLDLAVLNDGLTQVQNLNLPLTNPENILLLGIGGSMLGPQCILDALYHPTSNTAQPKVICLDNIDPYTLGHLAKNLDWKNTICLVQSKSGNTPETLAQYLFFQDIFRRHNLDLCKHFIFVTDPSQGYLRSISEKENIPCCDIPPNIGGRFSVLTPVGLLISRLVGIDPKDLIHGAETCLQNHWDNQNSPAFEIARIAYAHYQQGRQIQVIMPYSNRLQTFAKWTIQLISESLGKALNKQGQILHAGVTPLPAVGVTDQHSQLQLFQEGPNDKLLFFISLNQPGLDPIITQELIPDLAYLHQISFNQLLQAELQATQNSLAEAQRPSLRLDLQELNTHSLGELFMFFQLYTAYLGEMLDINAFDQPGVERSKILTKTYLQELQASR